jgi:methyltransferase family protein
MQPEQRERVVAERSRPRHGDFGDVGLPTLPTVDGLISPAEERYLYWLTSSMYTGEGAVVELGSWFGRSAIALGAGLRDAGWNSSLYCFDRFRWQTQFSNIVTIADVQLPDGGDFMPYFLANVRPIYPEVVVTKTTIDDLVWDGPPIELLFLDAPKSFHDLATTLLTFGSSLIAGRSLLILQDFFFSPAFPISMTVAAMAGDLRLVHTVLGASTAAFVVDRPPVADDVPDSWKYWTMSDDDLEAMWRSLIAQIPDEQHSMLEPALAFYYLEQGKLDKARRHMSQIEFSTFGRKRLDFLQASSAWGPRVSRMLETA